MADSLPTFACDLSAIPKEQRQQHEETARRLFQNVWEIRSLDDGYSFRLDATQLVAAAEFVTLERLCCPFFNFGLVVESGSGSVWLNLTGSKGVKAFIQAEFGGALAPELFPQ